MKKILVLTDFSYSSFNATKYAVQLANSFNNCEVMVYHSFYYENVAEPTFVPAYVDTQAFKKQSKEKLKDLYSLLKPFLKNGTKMELKTDDEILIAGAEKIAKEQKVDLVIMGGKNHSIIGKLLFGSKVHNFINFFSYPVMIIPEKVIYEPFIDIILACELKEVERIPVDFIKNIIKNFSCKLHVLNIDTHKHEKVDIKKMQQQEKLHELLDFMNPEYHYSTHPIVEEGLATFAEDIEASLIVVIHKQHGFFQSLIHASTTKKLATIVNVPLLVLREKIGASHL